MHRRPIGDLVFALTSIGADVEYLDQEGFPPLKVGPGHLQVPASIKVDGRASSQFLTGLLQAAPLWSLDQDAIIEVQGELISRPYVNLTLDLMKRFGVEVEGDVGAQAPRFRVPSGAKYRSPGKFLLEGDASSAAYFLGLGALTGGEVWIRGLAPDSVQPDARLLDVLEEMGAEVKWQGDRVQARSPGVAHGFRFRNIDLDLNHMPDAAMTVAVLCLFARGRSILRNIGSWRVKETDRLSAMACELRKFGAQIDEGPDWLAIQPPEHLRSAAVDTYDDHRMAMSLSLAACGGIAVEVRDPSCVAKTFPDYFEQLSRLTTAS
jgi:3-phosphoshikimate 1-carboxyvinyltransferase